MRLQRELRRIALSLSLFAFSNAVVGVFIPLIILKTGAPLPAVAGFYLAYALIKLALNYPVILLIRRYGAHIGLAVGFMAGALQMVAILDYARSTTPMSLIIGAAGLALCNACVWSSAHLHISNVMEKATKSSSMATIEILRQIISVAGPVVGAILGTFAGPNAVLVLALAFALLSLLPLRGMTTGLSQPSPRRHIGYDLRGAPPRDLVANFCFNVDTAVGSMLWPIFLAVAVSTYRGIGAISAFSALAAVGMVWLAGRRGDKGQDRHVLKEGIAASSLIHLLRIFTSGPLSVTLLSAGYRATLAYFQNAWVSTYYAHAKEAGIRYILSMEIACDLAYVFLWAVIYVCAISGNSALTFNVGFALAAMAAWGCVLITPQALGAHSKYQR